MGEAGQTFGEEFSQFEEIRRLWAAGRLRESADLLRTIPPSAEQMLAQAQQRVYEADATGESALTEVRHLVAEAVAAAPTDPAILVAAALIQFDVEDYREAQERLHELHDLAPALEPHEDAAVVYLVGMIAWWLGRIQKVESALRRAVDLDPSEATYRRALDRFLVNKRFPRPRI